MNFTISSAYQWPKKDEKQKTNNSEKAIKKIVSSIKNRFAKKKLKDGSTYKIAYKRLRASAGKTMLDSIIKRIETSQVVIIDISDHNSNVFIELGIALQISRTNRDISVYLIKEKTDNEKITDKLPSDLQGYFISEYALSNSKIVYKDNNSLLMSIVGDINDFFDKNCIYVEPIDEIDFKE